VDDNDRLMGVVIRGTVIGALTDIESKDETTHEGVTTNA
jgi:hypothetical protein